MRFSFWKLVKVSERHWGTCREDYASHGNSWIYLPFEAFLGWAVWCALRRPTTWLIAGVRRKIDGNR